MRIKTVNRRMLMAGMAGLCASAALPRLAAALPTVQEIAHDQSAPALTNPQGDVTIVEFVDYQCPYCRLCYLEILKLAAEDPGIRLVMKDWPVFGPASEFAARALLASTDNQAYGRAIDLLMRSERKLTTRHALALLQKAGMDLEDLSDRMTSRKSVIDLALARNAAHAVDFKLAGTPALLVGNLLYRRGLPLEEIRRVVATARAATVAAAG